MNEFLKEHMRIRMEQAKKALEAHHIKTYLAIDANEACAIANSMIADGTKVCDGGSMTLSEIGLIQILKQRNINYVSHNDSTLSRSDSEKESHAAFTSDTFISGVNAITMHGEIINVDGRGNRVAAMIYGPQQVILLAGSNKLVQSEEEAKQRIQQIAAPANCIRLKRKTPCVELGSCANCESNDRICNYYVKIDHDFYDRIRVILIEQTFGY